jgi:transcriptional regulator
MYTPPAFRDDDVERVRATIRAAGLAHFVTATDAGLMASQIPMLLDETEGAHGVLYGHVAKANPQWRQAPTGEALAIFMGADAYVSPSLYATKRETGKVVPTWSYVTVHAHGPAEFFEDAERLRAVVTRLTDRHEQNRAEPWAITDAPADYIASQLKGIVGVRMPLTRIEAKRKLSQNRTASDRASVAEGLAQSEDAAERAMAALVADAMQTPADR